jgi:hypothetical protein
MAHFHTCSDCETSIEYLAEDTCPICLPLVLIEGDNDRIFCETCLAKLAASLPSFDREFGKMKKLLAEEKERLGFGLPIH